MKTKRILSILLAALTIVAALLSLAACGAKDSGVDYSVTDADKKAGEPDAWSYFVRILTADAALHADFIAAYNGYNVYAEGFDDSSDEALAQMPRADGIDYVALGVLIDKVAEKASDSTRETVLGFKAELNDKLVTDIVNDSQTDGNPEVKKSVVDNILYGIGWFLGLMTKWFGGYYAVSIFFFALLIKVLFLPFAIKQQKSQIKNAKLQPKIAVIRAKYKGRTDQVTMRKMQEEIMALQQKEGASPLSGCLPLLIQFPILIALYRIVTDPLQYVLNKSSSLAASLTTFVSTRRAAGGLGLTVSGGKSTITLLGMAKDSLGKLKDFLFFKDSAACYDELKEATALKFDLFGTSLAETPSFKPITILVLIPFVAAALQWLTMFLTKRWNGNASQIGQDPSQQNALSMKIMDLLFPALTLWMAFSFSGMLGLYWTYQSLIAILQAYILHKVMPMPVYSEEELKQIQKAQKEAEKAQRAAAKEQPRVKSLHYIDEDDYDELPEVQTDGKKKPALGRDDLPEIKD